MHTKLALNGRHRIQLDAGVILHHFGMFDAAIDRLDRPIWVSDDFTCANEYKQFGVLAPRYTTFRVLEPIQIVDLNGVWLQPIAAQLGYYDHAKWNRALSAHLLLNGLHGLVYAGREIMLAFPIQEVEPIESVPTTTRA